jgi:hypothetical protein
MVRGLMAKITVVLLTALMIFGAAGIGGFFLQVFRHLKAKSPLPTRKNAVIRILWTLLLSALMLSILASESISSDTLICAGTIFLGITCLVVFAGYFIEKQYNQFIRRQQDGKSQEQI